MNSTYLRPARHGGLRQTLVRPLAEAAATQGAALAASPDARRHGTIRTLPALRAHLQTAIELEHSTIPPYLTALYTMDANRNPFAYRAIQGVAMEEMLHMVQACNLLNAVGGRPQIDKPDFIPSYPTYLPHSDDAFLVPLQKFSKKTLDVFLQIELPAAPSAPPQADRYHSIGQFYEAIREALVMLDAATPGGIFSGDPARQVGAEHFYGGGGQLLVVRGLGHALEAIEEIIGQGEGIDRTIFDTDAVLFGEQVEYAHYFRFNEVRQGRRYLATDTPHGGPTGPAIPVDWDDAIDMAPNPRLADYPEGSPVRQQMLAFNRGYTRLLRQLHRACNGHPQVLREEAVATMYELKVQALALLNLPDGRGRRAGPSFEYAPS
jgi:hypothetical protein